MTSPLPSLFEVTDYAVFFDTDMPGDDSPLFEGPYHECAAFVEEHPNTHIVWFDDDMEWAPSATLQ